MMKRLHKKIQLTVSSQLQEICGKLIRLLVMAVLLVTVSCSETEQASKELKMDTGLGQAVFGQPAEAANALTLALETRDNNKVRQLLGDDYREVLSLEDVQAIDVENYLKAWAHTPG
jgi:hypothetical protein